MGVLRRASVVWRDISDVRAEWRCVVVGRHADYMMWVSDTIFGVNMSNTSLESREGVQRLCSDS